MTRPKTTWTLYRRKKKDLPHLFYTSVTNDICQSNRRSYPSRCGAVLVVLFVGNPAIQWRSAEGRGGAIKTRRKWRKRMRKNKQLQQRVGATVPSQCGTELRSPCVQWYLIANHFREYFKLKQPKTGRYTLKYIIIPNHTECIQLLLCIILFMENISS